MDIRIESLIKKDEDFLWEMLFQTLHVSRNQKPHSKKIFCKPPFSKYAEAWGSKNDIGLIAFDLKTNTKIGLVWLRLFLKEDKGYVDDQTPELSMAIIEEYRGKGVGSFLLNEIINIAKRKYQRVSLSVSTDNPAFNLYKRFGFKIVSKTSDSFIMIKEFK